MRLPFLALAVVAALVSAGGAGCARLARGCSDAGCTSTVTVDVGPALAAHPGTAVVEVCVRGRCHSVPVARAVEPIAVEDDRLGDLSPGEVVVTLLGPGGTVLRRGKVTAAPARVQPNGEGCPPVCGVVDLTMTAGGELVSRG